MSEKIIDEIIKMSDEQESNAHGSNKKCFLVGNYALLKQKFTTDEIDKMIQITSELKTKGIKVADIIDYKVLSQSIGHWNFDRNAIVSEGYVLQKRAIGTPLLDRTNRNDEGKKFQLDYLRQIDSISKENQDFFNNFVRGWIEIQNSGIRIDPSKTGNFIYEQGKNITFIDLGLTDQTTDIKTEIYEQLAVILNLSTYNKCYPEVKQAVDSRLNTIMKKYKKAILEQGIDIESFNQVLDSRQIFKDIQESNNITQENLETEIKRLEINIANHIKEEQEEAEKIREKKEQLIAEKERKKSQKAHLAEEDERKNGEKRRDAKMYALLYGLLKEGIIPEEQAEIYKQVFQIKKNLYDDINPQLFKMQGQVLKVNDIVPDLKNDNVKINICDKKISCDKNISNETYEQIKIALEQYLKEYFERISKNANVKIEEYSKMKEQNESNNLSEEQYIEFRLLEAELTELSQAKQLFPFLGVGENIIKNSDKVSNFLEKINKLTPEDEEKIENRKTENDIEFLESFFYDTGIKDLEKLKEFYYSQNEIRVPEKVLQIVLENIQKNNKEEESIINELAKETKSVQSDILTIDEVESIEKREIEKQREGLTNDKDRN